MAHGVFQIAKLRSELEMVSGNVRVMSEMLTELVPTQAEPADLELLQVSPTFPTHATVFVTYSEQEEEVEITVEEVEIKDFGLPHMGIRSASISWFEQNSSSCLSLLIYKMVLISPFQNTELSRQG